MGPPNRGPERGCRCGRRRVRCAARTQWPVAHAAARCRPAAAASTLPAASRRSRARPAAGDREGGCGRLRPDQRDGRLVAWLGEREGDEPQRALEEEAAASRAGTRACRHFGGVLICFVLIARALIQKAGRAGRPKTSRAARGRAHSNGAHPGQHPHPPRHPGPPAALHSSPIANRLASALPPALAPPRPLPSTPHSPVTAAPAALLAPASPSRRSSAPFRAVPGAGAQNGPTHNPIHPQSHRDARPGAGSGRQGAMEEDIGPMANSETWKSAINRVVPCCLVLK